MWVKVYGKGLALTVKAVCGLSILNIKKRPNKGGLLYLSLLNLFLSANNF